MPEKDRTGSVRHQFPDRLFHWVMAVAVIVLGATAFLPMIGVRFVWVPIHWWSGIVLTLAILFHLYRVLFVHGVKDMVPGTDDVSEVLRDIRNADHKGLSTAKYDAFQKSYHWLAAIVVLVLTVTGLLMLAKIDTMFWNRNPAILTDQNWGIVYVIHGIAALAVFFLVIVHTYFGLLPQHRAFLISMLRGPGPENARTDKI